jgi:hypothetical protein
MYRAILAAVLLVAGAASASAQGYYGHARGFDGRDRGIHHSHSRGPVVLVPAKPRVVMVPQRPRWAYAAPRPYVVVVPKRSRYVVMPRHRFAGHRGFGGSRWHLR